MDEKLRTSGVKVIGDIFWGTHLCQFYQTQEELMDILFPYLKAGLENNEICIWALPQVFETKNEAAEYLKKTIPELDIYLEKGQIEIIPYKDWYSEENGSDPKKTLKSWIEKADHALDNGYDGLRLIQDTSWLKKDWKKLIDFEEELDGAIENSHIAALCTYFSGNFDTNETIHVALNHRFVLIKKAEGWKKIENSRIKKAEKAVLQAAKKEEVRFREIDDKLEKLVEERTIELEKAYESLKKSKECLAKSQKMAHVGSWTWDVATGELHWSDEVYRIFRRNPKEFSATYDTFLDHVHPDDQDYVINAIKKGFDGNLQNIDYRITLPDGEERAVNTKAEIIFDEENIPVRAVGIVQDITERKRVEEALRESEARLKVIVSNSPEIIFEQDRNLSYIWIFNPASPLSVSDVVGKTDADLLPPDQAQQLTLIKRRVLDTGVSEQAILQLAPGGEPRWYEAIYEPRYNEAGKVIGVLSYTRDITERKRMEEDLKKANETLEEKVKERTAELENAYSSLKESEKGLAEAQKMAHIGNWDWDFVTEKVYWSEELYHIFGLTPRKFGLPYDKTLKYIHPEDREYVDNAVKRALKEETYEIDYKIISADGVERTVHAQGKTTFDEENNPVRIRGTIQDITERKQTEKALELSEERYRIVVEQTGQLVYDYNVEADIADWAGNVKEITGYTPEKYRDMNLEFLLSRIHPEDRKTFLENYEKFLTYGGTYRTEYRFRKENGEYIYVEDHGVCLRDKKGKVKRILGAIKDITERIKAEKALANIEAARKREIHHRIKNNLQVISSLLDLQAEKFENKKYVNDPEVLAAFRESQDRVMSIALIHEELHEGKGIDKLNFSLYLEKLVENLFKTYKLGDVDLSLNIELEEDILFDTDTAVPLGLIVNEILSNSLKYAFSGRNKGVIQMKLCREKKEEPAGKKSAREYYKNGFNNFILVISDDGVGLPEKFNIEDSDSLGLQLISILIDQLDGKLELKKDSGTEFTIRFPVT